jgi:hypothetical protein
MLEDIRLRGLETLVACAQGDFRQVLLLAQEVLDLAHYITAGRFYTLLAFALVVDVLLYLAGNPDAAGRQARGLALQAVDKYLALSAPLAPLAPRRLLYRGWALLLRGRHTQATRDWDRGLAACAGIASPYDAARLHLLLSQHTTGERSAMHAREASRLFMACGMAGPTYALMPGG